jgi:Ca-activated chloride channel family protein
MKNYEYVIDQIILGKTPKNVDPEIVKLIQEAILELEEVNLDPEFKVELTEKIHAKLEKNNQPFWQRFGVPAGVTMSFVLLAGGLYLFNPGKLELETENLKIKTQENNNLNNKIKVESIQTQIIPKEDNTVGKVIFEESDVSKVKEVAVFDHAESDMMGMQIESYAPIQERKLGKMMIGSNQMEYRHPGIMPPIEPPFDYYPPIYEKENRENYEELSENPIQSTRENPVSTFSIDVDTAGYSNIRRFLRDGDLPPQNAVRVEEMINYFSYEYEAPKIKETPFSTNLEIAETPWNSKTKLLHIGIKGYEKTNTERLSSNLVFLLDISGSMNNHDKLPLLKKSLKMLSKNLNDNDKISIVTYAGGTSIVLDGADGNNLNEIEIALDNLNAGGSTAGGAGIELAYKTAEKNFIKGGINRILLATDGDFNVGITDFDELKEMVEKKRENGVSLTTLGFGTGNVNDHLMEQLADSGNGNYAYIDSVLEAQKVLVTEIGSTLETIAKDVKIQIEFNPKLVGEYRLIGYENRILNREDFNNDKIDAGEIGAGHTVTAIYEIALVGEGGEILPELRYGDVIKKNEQENNFAEELAFLKIRYKAPDGNTSKLLEFPVKKEFIVDQNETSNDFRFAASLAAFGQKLKDSKYLLDYSYDDILSLAKAGRGNDQWGYRAEFIQLIDLAKNLED